MSGTLRVNAFLVCYAECGSIKKSCEAAGINAATHRRHLKKYPEYKAAFEVAQAKAQEVLKDQALAKIEALEDALFTRAVEGWDEPIVFKGKFCYERERGSKGKWERGKPLAIKKYDHSGAQFLLRALKPETYREKVQVEHSGTVDIVERLHAARKRAAEYKAGEKSE